MHGTDRAFVRRIAERAVAELAPDEADRFDEVWKFLQAVPPDPSQDRSEPHFFEHPLVVQFLSPVIVGIVVGLVPIVYDIVKTRRCERTSSSTQDAVRGDSRVTTYSRRVSKRLQHVRLKVSRDELIESTLSIIVEEIESDEQAADATDRKR